MGAEGWDLKTRPKGGGRRSAGLDSRVPIEREPGGGAARVRLGSYEFQQRGISRFDLRDPYRIAVALTWPHFLAALLGLYLIVNVVFATLYWLVPGSVANARPNSFTDVFFFSVETVATVGYGAMYPSTLYGHVVVTIEIICGLGFTAILTGLTFVRFSRPRAKLVFAANPVVAMHDGKPTLMVRIGNGVLIAKRLRQELDRSSLYRLDGHRDVAVSGDEDDRNVNVCRRQLALETETTAARQPDIEHEASGAVRAPFVEEFGKRRQGLGLHADGSDQTTERLSDLRVVIDNDDGRVFGHRLRLLRWRTATNGDRGHLALGTS